MKTPTNISVSVEESEVIPVKAGGKHTGEELIVIRSITRVGDIEATVKRPIAIKDKENRIIPLDVKLEVLELILHDMRERCLQILEERKATQKP